MIHSIISEEDIFRGAEPQITGTRFLPLKYGFLEVEDGGKVRRLISTDLKDYLNQKYQPF